MLEVLQRINLQRLSGVASILGIDLTEKRARVVELSIKGGIVNKFNASFVSKNHFTVPFDDGLSIEARVDLIANELSHHNITTRYAATTIQSLGVRSITAEIPRTTNNINEWIGDNFEKLIRIPVARQDIVYGYEILSKSQNSLTSEITFVRRSDIEQTEQFFSLDGLTLLSITAGTRDAINALFFSDHFLHRDVNTFIYFSESHIDVAEFENKRRKRSNRVESRSVESPTGQSNIIVGGEVPENRMGFQIFSLPSEYTLAAGCALKGFIPELHSLNLLPGTVAQSNDEMIHKNLFHRTVFASGGVLLLLLVLQALFSIYIASSSESLDNQLIESGLNYSELTLLEKQNKELQFELQKTGSMEFRSNNAALLHEIASFVPDGLWLYKIETDVAKGRIIIAGYTSSGDRIAEFLKRCEKCALFYDIRLTRSGMPLQNEDMSFAAGKVRSPITFHVQASLHSK